MTSKAGHTAGPCEFHTQPYDCRSGNGLDHSIMDDDGVVTFVAPPGPANEEFQKRGHFIAEAFTVAHETGLTPRQLAEQREELLGAATLLEKTEEAHANCDECGGEEVPELCPKCFPLFDDARLKRRAAIAKATAGGA